MNETGFEPYQIWLAGVVAVTLVLLSILHFRLLLRWDKQRITRYLVSRGGQVRSIHWLFFGTGWLVHKKTRAYSVDYVDAQGVRHRATCRTAWLAGVYLTEE